MILGPYTREQHASIDETAFVATLSDAWPDEHPGRVMIDVGAHVGGSLVHFAKRGWRIHAFEPDSNNRERLANFTKQFRNVSISDRAVSDIADEDVALYSSPVSSGISTLSPFHGSHRAESIVKTTTLGSFVKEQSVARVDFLKIDVEGFEMKVLTGFPFSELTPRVIECEFEDAKTVKLGYTADQLAEFLVGKGYSVFVSEWHPVVRYGVKHDWRCLYAYTPGSITPGSWG